MAEKEFLDLPGLASYDGLIKTHITERIQELADGDVKTNADNIKQLEADIEANEKTTDSEIAALNARLFVGTYAEFQTALAEGRVAIGAIVIITDDVGNNGSDSEGGSGDNSGDDAGVSTTAVLGEAVLGYMKLG